MKISARISLVAFLVLCFANLATSDESNHRYKVGDPVPLYVNKVGPFHNSRETYAYYDLPFCLPDNVIEKKASLGEMLNGDRLVSGPYKLEFQVEKNSSVACKKKLKKEEVLRFRSAIAQDYYIQMYCDDVPLWSFIGRASRTYSPGPKNYTYQLYTDIAFEVLYNKEHVIEVKIRTNQNTVVDLTEDKVVDVEFTYTVKWRETSTLFGNRMERYYLTSKLPHHMEIHWFSVMNSCLTVLILLGCLVVFYMRVVKRDINKYANEELLSDNLDETGWKIIHGDVFRYPEHKYLFSAAVGSGTQLFIISISIIVLGVFGVFQPYSRGSLLTALVIIYAITSVFAGYTAVRLSSQFEGTNWVKSLLLTAVIFVGPLSCTFGIINIVATAYNSTTALPLRTILVLLSIWIFGAFPLLVLGGITAKNNTSPFESPCRTTKVPREVPHLRWYRGILPQMALAGFLPFGVIYVELYYLFASLWGHRVYTIYAILLIVFATLLIVTAFVTVALTYFQLAAEDHKWWWRSFLCGGSTGCFIYAYSLYYYLTRSDMSGSLQLSIFFGYMACISFGSFLMLGAIGFRASLLFLRHIYGSIKCE